ncbi:MAG: hypothetical protein HRK26_01935 [Rickettsiaceae bacterium H1]|nr:hypothetical protein [Rickettsiaceae bacterium H1]
MFANFRSICFVVYFLLRLFAIFCPLLIAERAIAWFISSTEGDLVFAFVE